MGTSFAGLSKFDTSCCGDQGGFSSYDMVAVKPAGGSANILTRQGQDANGGDVVVGGVTLKAVGDAIVIGASNFRPEYTYFWLSQLGSGGSVQWYYLSSSGSWRLINGSGKPAAGMVLNSSASYSMDVGGYYAPDGNGFMAGGNAKADRVTWWATGRPNVTPWPADFAPQVLSTLDATPRYYLEGVVTGAFATAPVLNQVYERHTYDEMIKAKYGGSGYTPYIRWINNAVSKLTGWGFNAAGQYSYSVYSTQGQSGDGGVKVTNPLPMLLVVQLSDYPMRSNPPLSGRSPIKNIYAQIGSNPVCPGSYVGRAADVFDPSFANQYAAGVHQLSAAAWMRPSITD